LLNGSAKISQQFVSIQWNVGHNMPALLERWNNNTLDDSIGLSVSWFTNKHE